ncbi:MAG: hypothetical protein DCC67_01760 [Planctomycetota bacterium]|nr:MAG: hypothetical protein DCC67_01760 [Planctomycetota bacterium]
MKTMILAIAATALLGVAGSTAEAGHGGVSISVGYHGHGGHGGYPHRRFSYYPRYGHAYGHGFGYGGHWGHAHWHDTSHFDFHPGGYYRHRNHYHYVPDHFDWHEDGHWDHH